MRQIGTPASSAAPKGVCPVLRDGAVVATMRASSWKEAASAEVGGRFWIFAKRKNVLAGRWASEPEKAARVEARPTSRWKGSRAIWLEGTTLEAERTSAWASTGRYLSDGRKVAQSGTTGRWTTLPTPAADDSVALEPQGFLLWLEPVAGRRNAATTAGAGSS